MSDTDSKMRRQMSDADLSELRREVERLELLARRKKALEEVRGAREAGRGNREQRRAERQARLAAKPKG